MEYLFQFSRWLHIVSGFLAILILWLPVVTRKGGKFHVRSGWIFVAAMTSVSITALYMGVYRLVQTGSSAEDISFSWFLLFIAILTGAATWYGIRVLRYKKRTFPHKKPTDLLFPILLLVSSLAISIYGWIVDFPLLQYFPIIGLFLGVIQLQYWLSIPKRKSHWVVEHINGMLSSGVAAVTAFTVFGAPRLLEIEAVSLIVWIVPTIIFVPLIVGFSIYFSKKIDRDQPGTKSR